MAFPLSNASTPGLPARTVLLLILAFSITILLLEKWHHSDGKVSADSAGSPQIEVRPIGGDSSLTVYYPGLNKLFVYQTPFVGLPTWNCSYSIQLSTPGGKIERKPCANPGQQF